MDLEETQSIMNSLANIKDPEKVKENLDENSEKIKILK